MDNLAELHLHLGASIPAHFLWEIAHEQSIKLQEKNYWNFIKLFEIKKTTSDKYLRKLDDNKNISPFALSQKIQSSPFAIEKCIHYTISRAYREQSTTKIEIRFNPLLRNQNGQYDIDKIILSAIIGMQKAIIEYPIKAGIILETDRQFDYKKHQIIVEKAIKYKKMGIIGVDVSGPNPKNGFNVEEIIEPLNFAKKNNLKITFHTGEFTDTDEVWQVVKKINPDRIGHGIKASKDKSLMKEIKKRNIILEICPTSNIQTQVVKNWQEMKKIIQTFLKNDVLFTINSDGTVFFNTNVKKEFLKLMEKNILTEKQVKNIINLSHKASFI